jgi:NADH-quinone oxidoreductase subunit G
MPTVFINGQPLDLPGGQRLNAIQAAALLGIEIPRYCYHPALTVVGSCRMCLIEVGSRDAKSGEIRMLAKLVPGCTLPVTDGMVIVTDSEKVKRARAMVEEHLLLRHPIDCPICDKAGECLLQDYYFRHGQSSRRADIKPFTSRRRSLGDVDLFVDRCIMCSRCVRFCAEQSGTNELMVVNRGAHEEIDVMPGRPLHNNLSGNVVDLCPVGALADQDFLYKQRVWFLRRHAAVCTGCAVGCSIWIDENQDRIYRLAPRENMHVNRWWLCNEGRYGWHHVHDRRRLIEPCRRDGQTAVSLDWTALPDELTTRLRQARHLGGLLSPYLSVEEAWLLAKFLRQLDPQALLAAGPAPKVGEDERFRGGFVVSAEKAPNRRGVEEVVAHFMHRIAGLEDLVGAVENGEVDGAWVAGGYKTDWIDEATARRFARAALLIVQDLFPSPLSALATYELPGAACAERQGSYVNRGDRLQTSSAAIRPPWGVRTECSLYWQLLGRPGLYQSRTVLDELSREVLYFAAATEPLPAIGLDLKINLIAQS